MKSIIKGVLGLVAVCCVGAGIALQKTDAAAESIAANKIDATITEINNEGLDGGAPFVMVLSACDYITAKMEIDKVTGNITNYKWVNAEDISDRATVDFVNQNVCNAPLDKNLGEYNFEDYIFFDNVPLSEFSQSNAYSLIANKRQRMNTLSIDFLPNVLSKVGIIEIREGCQLPTMAYSYSGTGDFSYIEIQETVMYENKDGKWLDYFPGYKEGVEYACDENNFKLSLESSFKGHKAVPLTAYTDFFETNAVQGELLNHKVLVSASNTEKGNLMALKFVHPFKAEEYNRLNLRVYVNHQIDILTYNAGDVTENALGAALEAYTVGGGQFFSITLNSALYANDNGEIEEIVFQFVNDCMPQYDANGNISYDKEKEVIRDTFHFVSFYLENVENTEIVTEDSFMIVDGGNSYEISFRFNTYGAFENSALDTTMVELNGYSLCEILAECTDASAEWYPAKGVYQINVSLPKSYTGKAQIKNTEYGFAGNNMSVLKGLVFPDGKVLEKTYTCHLYAGENLLDRELMDTYEAITVKEVQFTFVEDSDNLSFNIYFSGAITSSLYNHACEQENWRADEDTRDIIDYDEGSSDIFVQGGYKSSLLDHIVINGRTIGEWHAYEASALTCVQVHYGVGLQLNRMDVRFEVETKSTYDQLFGLVSDGKGITIEILEGLKFMTNKRIEKTQVFTMNDGKFAMEGKSEVLRVYFDGREIQDGQEITVQTAVSEATIAVTGIEKYTVAWVKEEEKKVCTITYESGKTFTFTVVEDIIEQETSDGKGCASSVGSISMMVIALCIAVAAARIGGKKHEE